MKRVVHSQIFKTAVGLVALGTTVGISWSQSGICVTATPNYCPSTGRTIPAGTACNLMDSLCLPASSGGSSPRANMNPAMQGAADALGNASFQLGYKLGQWLFGGSNTNNPEAAAAAEQERQADIARQKALALQKQQEIFDRLSKALKLSGLADLSLKGFDNNPGLQLKGFGDLSTTTTSGGLQLKGFGDSPAGQEPSSFAPGSLQLKGFQDDSSTPMSGSRYNVESGCTPTGIPGLPGVYLHSCVTSQTSAFLSSGNPVQVAQAALTLSGNDQLAVEDAAVRLAEATPPFVTGSQNPAVTNFQEIDGQYREAERQTVEASQSLKQAQNQAAASDATVNVYRSQITAQQAVGNSPPRDVQQAMANLSSIAQTDEQAAVGAQQAFEDAAINLSMTRTKAVYALAAIPARGNTPAAGWQDKGQPLISQPAVESIRPPKGGATISNSAITASPRPTADLCGEIGGLQQVLQRLTQAQATQASDRQQWLETMDDATRDAAKQAADFTFGTSTDLLTKYLDRQMQETVTRRTADDIDASGRQKLDDQFKILWTAKWLISKVDDKRNDIQGYDLFDPHSWKRLKSPDFEDWLNNLKDLVDKTLEKPEVRQVLKLSDEGAKVVVLSESIIDSGYNIMGEFVSIKRMEAMNEETERYLAAVTAVNQKMKNAVAALPTSTICPR
jgi:hypothetical protein